MARQHTDARSIDMNQRVRWYAFVRLLFITGLSVPGMLALYIFHGWSSELLRDLILYLIALTTSAALYFLILLSNGYRYQRIIASIWIGFDALLVTAFIYANGGIESRAVIMYSMPILVTAALFGRPATYLTALGSCLLYALLLIGNYVGVFRPVGVLVPPLQHDGSYVVSSICFVSSVLMIIAVAVDFITDRLIRKEREAQESMNELQRAQDIAKLGSWEWDVPSDKITWTNGLARILNTYHAQQPLSYSQYLAFVHPDDQAAHRKTVEQALKKGRSFTSDYRIMMPDGQSRYVHTEGHPSVNRDGTITKAFGTTQDVTDLHLLDNAQRDFVSLASHQLRTPASGVKAFLSLLLDGHVGEMSRKQRQFITKAYEANNRQLDIIDGILSLASIESGKLTLTKQPVDLTAIVRGCLPTHKLEIRRKHQKMSLALVRQPIIVRADSTYLQMAIDNLISNAIKYTPERGHITIASHTTTTAVYLEVTDDGMGIAKQDIPRLFQKFSRLDDPMSAAIGGSGLGLYLARHIMKLHNGSISVQSRPGEGTRFRIRLPLASRERTIK